MGEKAVGEYIGLHVPLTSFKLIGKVLFTSSDQNFHNTSK